MKMLDSSSVKPQQLKWFKSNSKHFKDKDIRKWLEHLPHHTNKHLDSMLNEYKKGGSFLNAHKKAIMKVGK